MRVLRAFAWLRWRVLMNSLERSGARDTVERFSLAIEQLGPIMAGVLMIPSAIVLAGAGAYSGWALAQGHWRPLPFEALRFLLLAICALTIVGPLILPAGERTNAVRLLLLPISRRTLYAAQAGMTLTDPWMVLVVPPTVALPMGLAAGGAWVAAVVAACAGALLLVVLLGISSLATSLIHLAVRDRRRGELLTLLFILTVPLLGILPATLEDKSTRAARRAAPLREDPAWFIALEHRVLPLVPSEMYVRSTRASVRGEAREAMQSLARLAIGAGVLHAAGLFVFGRLLDSPGSIGSRRRAARRRARAWKLPGVSPGTSAVALAQVRLALRTPRGRSILLAPVMVFAMFGLMMWRGGSIAEFGPVTLRSGVALAVFGSFVSLVAIVPIAMNQFAIDGAGLTLEFLAPIDDRDLLRGKAIGNGVIVAMPALLCIAGAAALFPAGPLWMWLSIPPGIASAYVLVAPAAVVLSALFPRPVDLNSIGRGSNAHGAAGFLGFIAYVAAGALTLPLPLLTTRLWDRPHLTPALMLVWCALCVVLAWLLFVPARAVFVRRRENLALIR